MSSTTAGFMQSTSPGSSAGIGDQTNTGSIHRPIDADSGYCIDWCPNRSSVAMMVVGLGKEKGARVSTAKTTSIFFNVVHIYIDI